LRLLLLPLLSLAASAATLDSALGRLDALVRAQENKPANEIRELDKKIGALEPEFVKTGPPAVAPLVAVVRDAAKPLKERVWAVNFLALLADPAAFAPLSALALDKGLPDVVRAQALSAAASTGVDEPALRRLACGALAQEDLPAEPLREALLTASRVGCEEPRLLSRRAKDQGSHPDEGPGAQLADLAIRGLGRSHPAAAAGELLGLFAFYRKGVPQRGQALTALLAQGENLKGGKAQTVARACEALIEEGPSPANAQAALRLIVALDGRACESELLRELKNADPDVVTADAEALAALGLTSAIAPLSKILDGAVSDDRFGPRPGKADPVQLLDRIQRALIRLR
jgi:hypothetical protein